MFGKILSSLGGSIGRHFGGGILSTIGRYAGRMLGNSLDKKWLHRTKVTHKFTNVKDSFYIIKAKYGTPIPLIFGRMRVPGQIIWADQITEKRNTTSISKYFKQAHLTVERQTTALEYFASFAMAICEGEIFDIGRVWYNEDIIDLSNYQFRLYRGGEEQLPDPLISAKSIDPCPGYRGLAYIVFERLPLADFNDIIPSFEFEVTRKSNIQQVSSVEDLVTSMVMIPGSGEYVYDTQIQQKTLHSPWHEVISQTKINCHNHYNISNSVYSLNQLQMVCQNIQWVAPVVCWFGNNDNAKDCLIRPAVEFKDENISYSEEWKVGRYNRSTAYEVTKDEHNNPIYGGSVNDDSILRYLVELRSRNLKIMFYPMFFLDVPGKPWRGMVSGDASDIKSFFQRDQGYNEFILHYANLVKNHVDAFIIGSELIGLTKVNHHNDFPAVIELISLAQQVKQIVGPRVLVSYAADWSEYHHTEGGWFNLDPLWSSSAIDFVGIDAYFPVTNSSSSIKPEDLVDVWIKGEGYDYYIDQQDHIQKPLDVKYAWKNLYYWWNNVHINPDNHSTSWTPRLKPIWFTEFGFPSIDKAPNQPNIFFDPKCINGGVPIYSNGENDFAIQRKAIRAFIEYWNTQEYIGEMFLWTWDARPYPAWPHTNIWRDGYLWAKGHWVNNKFGASNVASIILEISHRCHLNIDDIDASTIDQPVEGFMLSNRVTGNEAIDILRASYFFDINTYCSELICFVKRGYQQEVSINSSECLKLTDTSYVDEIQIPSSSIINTIDLWFMNQENNYASSYKYFNYETASHVKKTAIRLPIAMTEAEAEQIGSLILHNAHTENRVIKFSIPTTSLQLKPSDFVALQHDEQFYTIRLINIVINELVTNVTGIIDNKHHYYMTTYSKQQLNINYTIYDESQLVILSLPFVPNNINSSFLAIYFSNYCTTPLYAKFATDIDQDWTKILNLIPSNSIAVSVDFQQVTVANIYHIDEFNYILIKANKLYLPNTDSFHYAMVGQELLSFKYIRQIEHGLYKVSHLIRGLFGTEQYMTQHYNGELFVLIDYGMNILPIAHQLEDQTIEFKCGNSLISTICHNNFHTLPTAYITKQQLCGNSLMLEWIPRSRNDDYWRLKNVEQVYQFKIIVAVNSQFIERQTSEHSITIDLTLLDLSAGYNIDITTIMANIN